MPTQNLNQQQTPPPAPLPTSQNSKISINEKGELMINGQSYIIQDADQLPGLFSKNNQQAPPQIILPD